MVTIHYLRYVTGIQGKGGVNGCRQYCATNELLRRDLGNDLTHNLFWRKKFHSDLDVG